MRREDRLSLLEKLLAAPQTLARMFTVPMSLRLLNDYDAVVAEARAACGHLTPDAVPLILDGCEIAWAQAATSQQQFLIAVGKAHLEGVAEREVDRVAAELAAQQPPTPQRKAKAPPDFIRTPSVFDNPTRA